MDKLYVIIPAYNEEENIASVIDGWCPIVEGAGPGSRLLILNDGSQDGTSERVRVLQPKYPCLDIIDKDNSGHGPTCLYGYQYEIDAGADYVFQTDSDGQTSPEEFRDFWQQRTSFDFMIGVRKNRQDGFSRKVITTVLRAVLLAIFGVDVKDANTPFRLMNAKRLTPYLTYIPRDFFLGNALLSALIVKRKESIKWIPVSFKPRRAGENSLNLKKIIPIGIRAVREFVKFVHTTPVYLQGEQKNDRPV